MRLFVRSIADVGGILRDAVSLLVEDSKEWLHGACPCCLPDPEEPFE